MLVIYLKSGRKFKIKADITQVAETIKLAIEKQEPFITVCGMVFRISEIEAIKIK